MPFFLPIPVKKVTPRGSFLLCLPSFFFPELTGRARTEEGIWVGGNTYQRPQCAYLRKCRERGGMDVNAACG